MDREAEAERALSPVAALATTRDDHFMAVSNPVRDEEEFEGEERVVMSRRKGGARTTINDDLQRLCPRL